ncbi:hypothetical protein PV04_10226 [Phialophora macrospora]|uniref:Uncharacterized protein n=1 Tax=Phialophora macrospora TaxID=1851006 RepID=A0A0D2DLX4_9EURO|nr:hypothetical protein PV04_10226 [Phialophora macrospora]
MHPLKPKQISTAMQARHQRGFRGRYPSKMSPLSNESIPPGYQWQDQVDCTGENALEQPTTSGSGAETPRVEIGKTLVFRMAKPSDWDTLDEQGKWQRKRACLCERYGDLCFIFLEDPEPMRNQLGRITVAPNDYYALFEVWSSPSAQKQYHATMVLLEEGLAMDLDYFLRLKSMLGMCWQQPKESSNKRSFDEVNSQPLGPSSDDDASVGNGAKRVRIQGPTPDTEPDSKQKSSPARTLPVPAGSGIPPAVSPTVSRLCPAFPKLAPAVSELAAAVSSPSQTVSRSAPAVLKPTPADLAQSRRIALSTSEIQDIGKALFPAAAWEPAAAAAKSLDGNATYCKCPRTESHTCGRYTTISGTPYARRMQALETRHEEQSDSHPRLCLHTGRGKKDADKAESKHRAGVFNEFGRIIQSCTDIATSCNCAVDEIMHQLAVGLGVAKDPMLASTEFVRAGNALKWAIVFWVFVKTSMAHYIGELGASKWASEDLSARTEMYQALQERAWQRFSASVASMGRRLLEGGAA